MRRAGERGSITILVLWGMAIVFVLLAAAGFTTRTELMIARNEIAAAQARHEAEAGTQLGLARLLARRARGAALFDGSLETWRDGGITVTIAIQDEAGKIDINAAPLALLTGLFVAVGRTPDEAFLLACRIAEHRGGGDPACPAASDTEVVPRGLAFAVPEELAALPGLDDRLYTAIADFVTVASGATAIDPMVAPRAVLLALPGATPDLVDAWLAGRSLSAALTPESAGFDMLGEMPFLMVSPLRDFTVSAVATTAEGARSRADLQVRLTSIAAHPYEVIAWRTPPLSPGPHKR